jgi:hypothetical protein
MRLLLVKESMAINKLKLLLLSVFLLPVVSSAQLLNNDEYGYSFEIDDSYRLVQDRGAAFFRSDDGGSIVIVKNWPGLTEETAKDFLLQGYQDARIAVVATSEPEEITAENGKGLQVDVQSIFERKLMKGVAAGFIGNNGQGMVMLVIASNEDGSELATAAQQATASVKFTEYSPPDARDWFYMLAGTRLSLRGESDDRHRREDLYFCSDGEFFHRKSSSAMKESDSASVFGYSTKSRSGLWTVVDDDGKSRLMLRYNDGREESAVIEDRDGRTFLDDQRFYMMRNNRCR